MENTITPSDFEKLPKNEQEFRWELFLVSEGYKKDLSKKQIKEIADKYKVNINNK